MREEELVIRYRIPDIPAGAEPVEKEMMEEAHRHFGQQVIGIVMEHMFENGVELLEARKKILWKFRWRRPAAAGIPGRSPYRWHSGKKGAGMPRLMQPKPVPSPEKCRGGTEKTIHRRQ